MTHLLSFLFALVMLGFFAFAMLSTGIDAFRYGDAYFTREFERAVILGSFLAFIVSVGILVPSWRCVKAEYLSTRFVQGRRHARVDFARSSATDAQVYIVAPVEQGCEMTMKEARCRVCGDDLLHQQKVVACRQCETPCHSDCWDFNGMCAVYGCGSIQTKCIPR